MYFCGIIDAIGVFMKFYFWFTYAIDTFYFTSSCYESWLGQSLLTRIVAQRISLL